MKVKKLNADGFAHNIIFVILIVVLGVVAAGVYVYSQRNTTKSSSTPYSSNSPAQSSLQNATDSSKTAMQSNTSNTSKTSTSQSSTKASSGNSAPKSTTTNTATPLSTLTSIITKLKSGTSDAKVTANSVVVPGPISDAHGRPIVFTLNGKTYFAYAQTYPPDFSLSASSLASGMALVNATVKNPALINAHLDKLGNLVDANLVGVGYSTGGN